MSAPGVRGQGYARANWGRWIVDCATPYCRGAMQIGWHTNIFGVQGDHEAWCKDCQQWTRPIVWPADPEAVEVILAARPDWTTRNCEPGETLQQLLADNVAHGDPVPGLDMADPPTEIAEIMLTIDDRVVGGLLLDALPSAEQRKSIGV